MFCPKCGTQNPDNGKYCRSCGTDLGNISDALSGKLSLKNQTAVLRDKKGKPIHWEGAITKLFSGFAFLVVAIALAVTKVAGGQFWWFWLLIPAFGSIGSGIAQIIHLRKMEKGHFVNSHVELPYASNTALPPRQEDFMEIQNLVNSGNKIEAIKVYRETMGAGLKDAKVAVERIERGELTYPAQTMQLNDYAPPKGSIYDTGELEVPPSVTEGTTRHLEINKDGETMTLPPKN